MSFMSGTRPGFYEDVKNGSSSSSFSFSPPHKGGLLTLYTYHYHHHHHHHHHQEPDQDSNDQMRRGTVEGSSTSTTRSAVIIEIEHMFDKVVTPSDVGKLNRLVIPKQHAEKYFPLDSSKAGLLLNFEDRNGKPWRFRYSYWNSSQSYVMTKGRSRFVKDKKLDEGDIVSFQRGVGESAKDRLFINWRCRRLDAIPS